ncbi:sensor histidine kinase [Nocardioides sp. CFH 31398]|uniref:sensor histidine kinase n=1 Tax=Nocardioides sp. CFH 31398 TaxID=2919579 RepID=UPI001F05E7ED|nr:histidine kinase [Nocardioides sp. CFH 31398]MCH1867168.1 histidine kinase [Nocardioides sp. CFH 31398]
METQPEARVPPPPPPISAWGHAGRALGVLAISAVALGGAVAEGDRATLWTVLAEVTAGVAAYVAVFWRRRAPMTVAVLTNVLAMVSGIAAGPAVLATVSVATRRIPRELVVVAVVALGSAEVYALLTPAGDEPQWLTSSANLVATAAILGWGMYIGSRRELLWTLRQRAERAEAEQELRVSRARVGERTQIAREMHDVLAHRISQISMHAGALAIRDDLGADELRDGAATIRERANEALTDLRDVLGVLRDAESGELTGRPQPTYADLGELVSRARQDGLRVDLDDRVAEPAAVPGGVGRTVYRIVQEGLTNAAKHSPGTTVTVTVTGGPEDGVTVEVCNPRPVGRPAGPRPPGSGLGLLGLSERTALRGGRLTHRGDGERFVLRGWVPWPG